MTWLFLSTTAPAARAFVWPSQVQRLQAQLVSGDASKRRECVREIRDAFSASFEPLVRAALRDSDREVRHTAAEIVAQHRLPVAEELAVWLSYGDAESRLLAARIFERVPAPQAEQMLLHASRDPEPNVRRAVAMALARFSSESVTSTLLISLSDVDGAVRRAAVDGLALRNEPRVGLALIAHTNDTDEAVRARAVLALGPFAQSQWSEVVLLRLRDESPLVRTAAAEALAILADAQHEPPDLASDVLPLISDEQPLPVVAAATRLLVRTTSLPRVELLFSKWAQLKRGAWRTAVAQWTSRAEVFADRMPELCLHSVPLVESEDCLPLFGAATKRAGALMAAVEAGKLEKRDALKVLARASDPTLLGWILDALGSADVSVVESACQALGVLTQETGAPHALDPLLLALTRMRNDSSMRATILRLIGKTRSVRAWTVLEPLLAAGGTRGGVASGGTATTEELVAAIEATGFVSHRGSGERLVELLFHAEREVARAAARELYTLPDASALSGLLSRYEHGVKHREEVMLAMSGLVSRSTDGLAIDRVAALLPDVWAPERDALIEGLARNPHAHARTAIRRLFEQRVSADIGKIAESITTGEESLSLLNLLVHDNDGPIRAKAVWSMGRLGSERELSVLQRATVDERLDVRANALVAIGRVANRRGIDVSGLLCRFVEDHVAGLREAALLGLIDAGQYCPSGVVRAVILSDSSQRVRAAAARLLARTPVKQREEADDFVMRWCVAFDDSASVRSVCEARQVAAPPRRGKRPAGTLVFASADDVKQGKTAEMAVGFRRSDGLIRYTTLDRRGALFEPDSESQGTRLLLPIALER